MEEEKIISIPLINRKKYIVGYTKISLEDKSMLDEITNFTKIKRGSKCYACIRISDMSMSLHNFILGSPLKGYVIDHINGDPLDNRRENLRFATHSQNSQNRIKKQNKYSSNFSGVSKNRNSFLSKIRINNEIINIGSYKTEIEAAISYDVFAIHYFGKNAKTNELLKDNEIQDILKNGIPEKYKKKNKVRELPKNIVASGEKYRYDIRIKGIRYRKTFDTVELALQALNDKIKELKIIENNNKIEEKITKNDDGLFVIYLKNKKGIKISEAIVDEKIWETLSKYKWSKSESYAHGNVDNKTIYMHIFIYILFFGEIPKGKTIDHINGNPLDNRIENLRCVNKSIQQHNQKKREKSSYITKYKGITIAFQKYRVSDENKMYHYFEYLEDAALKANEIAVKKFGEFAKLNIIDEKRTHINDFIPKKLTEEFINQIEQVEVMKLLIKTKNWGGPKGYMRLSKVRSSNLDELKIKAIELLKKGL